MSPRSVRVVALQDENHRIIDSAGQWMIQHRSRPGKKWMNDAFCVTKRGVWFFLECEAVRKCWGVGYFPAHLWQVPPRLPKFHPG